MITAGMVAELPQYKEVLERGRLQPFEVLVMFFLTEQPYSSSWASYLSVLPSTFSTPAFTESTLNADCLPPSVRNLWVNQQTELKTMFEKMCCLLTSTPSWERFLWAWHVVNTRCIFVENRPHPLVDNSNGDTIAVIPLVDMLNHSTNNQGLALWDSVNGCYKVIATRVVLEGDQLFVCYGGHSNGRLWIDYGFTLPENIYNKVNIDYGWWFFGSDHSSELFSSYGLCILCSIRSRWSEFVYEHDEEGSSELVIAILKKLLENLRRKMDIAPEKFRWLWQEQISLLSECVKNA
ncbi:SET domain-containing protein 4 [Toxocara canis]|uniref:SET domain-containing protein 4 n=1 Tax=Toxocara canis TaxID=6265 RepID=A0A0B2VN37_TOXCA|nr:SET domain-containing protein 4 [Toxocara canis]